MALKKNADIGTVAEMREQFNAHPEWFEKYQKDIENFANMKSSLVRTRDITKNATRTVSVFSKDKYESYMKNIGSNEKNIRNLSRFLFYRSQVYYRLIRYFATMLRPDLHSIIPDYDFTKNNDKTKMLKSYNDTLNMVDTMNLNQEMIKVYTICLLEDVFYGLAFYDETGLFVYPMDPDYCRISGRYYTGDLGFAINMAYFTSRQELLEYLGEPCVSMYQQYKTTNQVWQDVPDKYCICFKARSEDLGLILPIFCGLFGSLISLCDLESIQDVLNSQSIYKLIWMELETITGSKNIDDFKVDVDMANEYFDRLLDTIPNYAGGALVPGKLNVVSFNDDQATETTKIQDATEDVLNISGGAQILNSASISGTTAFTAAMKSDAQFALSLFLGQTEGWVNRFISNYISNPCYVKFFPVSIFTADDYKKELLTAAQNSLPTKLAYNIFNGFSEKQTMALNFLETEVLGLQNIFKYPLNSSYTQSGAVDDETVGAPTKDDTELTDDGEASRDKIDTMN